MSKIIERDAVKKDFLRQVENHSMDIRHDDGVYRHLVFTKGGSNIYRFDIVTYPGYLVISGDMGSYVFTRLPDMFQFFRDGIHENGDISINPGYWGEKLEAVDQRGGYMEWSKDLYKEIVTELYDTYIEEEDLVGSDEADELWTEIEDLFYSIDTEEQAYEKTEGFRHEGFEIHDFWEYNTRQHTFHYLWILFAIVWGIQQYDNK